MKKIKFLTVWLLVIAMTFSSVAVFGEEITDAEDEAASEEEIVTDEEVPVDEVFINDFIQETTDFPDTQETGSTSTEESKPSMTEEDIKNYNDAVTEERLSQYRKVTDVLESLGIYSFGDSDEEMTVTRGEFAKMVADLLNLYQAEGTAQTLFNDIENTPYKNEIQLVCYYGIMNGTGTSTFNPEGEITYQQAAKTIVTALGYQPIAQSKGGYPGGYMKVAIDLELFKGASEGLDKPITFLAAANLISLSAQCSILEAVGTEGDNVIYSGLSQRTVLAVYHNIYEDKGVMTDNGISAIGGANSVSNESTVIGGRVLQGIKNSYRDYLGCNVKYFYTTENGYDELLYVVEDEAKNNIVNIRACELLTDDSAFTLRNVVAEVNGKRRTYQVYKYADFMYNGVLDATFHNDSLKIRQGYLTLIDSDGDNVYELVKVWEYSDAVVDKVYPDSEKIVSKYSEKEYGSIEYGDYDAVLFADSYGLEITPEEIPSGSVLSVFRSKNNSYIKLVMYAQSADIEVSSVENNEDKIKIFYEDNEAELSYSYIKLNKLYPGVYPAPTAGQCFKVYFNYEGLISMMTLTEGREKYAYALAMAYGQGIRSSKVDIKLYFESGSWAVVPVADKLTINGVKNKTGADLMNDSRIYKDGAIIPQLVKVILNSKGQLSWIWIDNTADDNVFGFNLDEFSLDYYSDGSMRSDLSVSGLSSRLVNRGLRVTTDTKIFVLENLDKDLYVTDEEQIRMITYSEYIGVYSGGKHIKMYDADYTLACAAVVVTQPKGLSSRLLTVDKASYIIDEEGEEKVSIAGFFSGYYRVMRESESGLFSQEVLKRYPESDGKILKGDVFEIYINVDGEICRAKMCYSPQRDKDLDYCFVDLFHSGSGQSVYTNNQAYILGYPVFVQMDDLGGLIGVYTNENPDYVPLYDSTQSGKSVASYLTHPFQKTIHVLKYDCAEGTLEQINITDVYGAAQATSAGIEIADKTTKVFFKKSNGVLYDLLFVTNIGD